MYQMLSTGGGADGDVRRNGATSGACKTAVSPRAMGALFIPKVGVTATPALR
jgi:hypothetical protein